MLNDLYVSFHTAGTEHCFHGISLVLTFSLYPWPPFFTPSVIWNNLRASLDSIHQSRKKQALTLIKKKKIPSVPCRGKRSEREWDRKEREGFQMKQALLSPSCPPSSMPFQLKSAVVIKFQQGLGATVRRTDGGLPWHKDDTIQEDRGGQAEKEGGWQMLFIHVHCQIRTTQSSWHLKNRKWNGYSDSTESRNDLFPKSGIF